MNVERFRLPGLVDPHVHLREPGATQKEDFETGTMAAIAGGFTTVLDMPNNPEPVISPESLQKKITRAGGRVYCDIGFHFGATVEGVKYFEQVKNEVFGLKVYMNHTTGTLLMDDKQELNSVFAAWPGEKPIIVHAEGETLSAAIKLAKLNNKRLHVAHVATKKDIETIKQAKEEGLLVTCEVTPHHLFLTESDAQTLGPFGMMKPSLKNETDRVALWENLKSGVIDMVATDHAPHTKEEKLSGNPPFGVPGLETCLPLLLTAVAENELTLDQVVDLTSTNPRRIFGIYDPDETYIEVDLNESYIIDAKNLKTKCAWTPFEGKKVTGKVLRVVLRGKTIYDGEKITGEPRGNIIFPK